MPLPLQQSLLMSPPPTLEPTNNTYIHTNITTIDNHYIIDTPLCLYVLSTILLLHFLYTFLLFLSIIYIICILYYIVYQSQLTCVHLSTSILILQAGSVPPNNKYLAIPLSSISTSSLIFNIYYCIQPLVFLEIVIVPTTLDLCWSIAFHISTSLCFGICDHSQLVLVLGQLTAIGCHLGFPSHLMN